MSDPHEATKLLPDRSSPSEMHSIASYTESLGESAILHDDSVCPHVKPKRYCRGRLSRPVFCAVVTLVSLVVAGLVSFGIVYGVGEVWVTRGGGCTCGPPC